ADALWAADKGADIKSKYDIVIRIYAGYDETSVWQEFGEMKFASQNDIPAAWGNPDPSMPRWVITRYEPWTSWLAGAQQWGISSVRQGESSGTITHEIAHFAFRTGDNNNNPYVTPFRRVGSGPWDIMDRGSFNGPGGPHDRWEIPVVKGGAMPAGIMLRNKINFGFVTNDNIVRLSREGLAKSGPVVVNVVSRAAIPGADDISGIVVNFDGTPVPLTGGAPTGGGGGGGGGRGGRGGRGGAAAPAADAAPGGGGAGAAAPQGAPTTQDRTPWVDPATDPLSPGVPNFSNYTVEVVQRIGYDSFCPDSGVLLAKNKNQASSNGGPNAYTVFNWAIDAHPEDINKLDFKRPDGTPVMRTVADYRQLNDCLFHAGTNSGSQSEYEDTPNRLHFYIIDRKLDDKGFLTYQIGVRSLDGSGPQTRALTLTAPDKPATAGTSFAPVPFTLKNTGKAADTDASIHPQNTTRWLDSDIYRLSATIEGAGWTAQLQNNLAAVKFGESINVPVFVMHDAGVTGVTTVSLTAVSESDPGKKQTMTFHVTAAP
ncbi:MAG TPA: hypothetical protein VHM90_01925, partial [Phycisphaerae bacterium]|nr:hypothetical protein [Phycisphaerae bacterium]